MEQPKEYTNVPLLLKRLLIRTFLLLAGLPVFFYMLLNFFQVEFSLSLLAVLFFVFLLLIFIKKYFQKIINVLIKSNIYNKAQISELKEQYELKEIAYQELESLNFVVDNAALFASAKLDGTVLYMSKKFCELLGVEKKEIRGPIEHLLTKKEGEQQKLKDLFLTTRQKMWTGEVELTTQKEESLWLEISIIPMNKAFGKQSLFIIGNDVTERREKQEERGDLADRVANIGLCQW